MVLVFFTGPLERSTAVLFGAKQNKRREQKFKFKAGKHRGLQKQKKEFRRLKDLISTGKALYKQRITASGNVITGD